MVAGGIGGCGDDCGGGESVKESRRCQTELYASRSVAKMNGEGATRVA